MNTQSGLAFLDAGFAGATFLQLWRMPSPEAQDAWLRTMHAKIHLLQTQPGFVSMSLHLSLDGYNVVVYAQWTSAELLNRAAALPEVQAARLELDSHGEPDGTLFQVHSIDFPEGFFGGSMEVGAGGERLTFINVWNIPDKARQQNLLDALKKEDANILAKPGSRGTAFLMSLDGKRLAVYASWDSRAQFDRAISNDSGVENWNKLAEFGEPHANTYRVESVNLRLPQGPGEGGSTS